MMMNNSSNNIIDEKIYLVTQKVDIASLSPKKVGDDLNLLKSAEDRTQKRIDITYGKANNEMSRAMKALSLLNPFKGV